MVRVGVFLGVLVAALLPFVLRGTVASWAALAFLALTVVVAAVATVADVVVGGRAGGRRSRWDGIAVIVVVLVFAIGAAFQGESEQSNELTRKAEEQAQEDLERFEDCAKTLPAKTCVRRAFHLGGSSSKTSK